MKTPTLKQFCLLLILSLPALGYAQTNPAITSWLINSTGIRGKHYVSGNSTPIQDTAHANVQQVRYDANNAYINSSSIPSYIIGPYLDRNPSQGTNRKNVFRIPLNPVVNNGTKTAVSTGNIAVLINGVTVYNAADAMSYNNLGIWKRNAIYFENAGFDCSKGHPSPVMVAGALVGGTYHHHQNPSAFKYDVNPGSTVCNLYTSDGLYIADSTRHSPLIGFSFDGFPIYGGYGYANSNGTGGIKRMRPSYQKRNITDRTTKPDGTVLTVAQYGPSLATYPLGAYIEDHIFVANSGDLDVHNGRFSVTPEYPNGIYCYFATIDQDYKSVYPYVIGTTYYGVVAADNFPIRGPGNTASTNVTVPANVTVYTPPTTLAAQKIALEQLYAFPNPADEYIALQVRGLLEADASLELYSVEGKFIAKQILPQGSTLGIIDTRTVYDGFYLLKFNYAASSQVLRVVVRH